MNGCANWQHENPLQCPKGHTMVWLGSAFWLCPKGKCHQIYVQMKPSQPLNTGGSQEPEVPK